MKKVGIISDTHGLIRPEALNLLKGSDLIVHAGDIGSEKVLTALKKLAPVNAVQGNIDFGNWVAKLPKTEVVEIDQILIYVIHNLDELDLSPVDANIDVVVYGHSHKPLIEKREGVFFINPGSAGPRRFHLPISIALLDIEGEKITPQILTLA